MKRALLLLPLALVALLLARPAQQVNGDKVDPRVARKTGDQTVFVMLKDQIFLPGEYEKFTDEHEDAKRRSLRTKLIKEMKQKSSKTSQFAQSVLGDDIDVRVTWLVNGFGAVVSERDLEALSKKSEVMYIYPLTSLPPTEQSGKVPLIRPDNSKPTAPTREKKTPWNIEMTGVDRVWDELGITGKGATVAMFDGGVDISHPDLTSQLWQNSGEIPNNGKDDDGNGYIDDRYGFNFDLMSPNIVGAASRGRNHGTMTSGIVAGSGRGGVRTGLAPGAKLMPIIAWGGPLHAMKAFEYMLENGADAVNMSFSIPNLGNTRGLWRLMAEHATAAGLVMASGAGNFQQQQKVPVQQRIPEAIPCVVSAGGVDRDMKVVRFSSLGPVEWSKVKFYEDYPMPDGLTKPDVTGFPGAGYPVLDGAKGSGYIDPNNSFRGNSFSGPHVAGVVALMLEANPDLTAWKIKEILESTAKDIDPPGKDNRTGAGLLQAYAAVKAALASAN